LLHFLTTDRNVGVQNFEPLLWRCGFEAWHHGALYPQAPDALAPPVLSVRHFLVLKATDSRCPRISGRLMTLCLNSRKHVIFYEQPVQGVILMKRDTRYRLLFVCSFTFVLTLIFCFTPNKGETARKRTSFTTTEINEAFYDKAWRNFQIGNKNDRKAVINALRGILRKNPEEFMAHYYLGIMILKDGSPTTALRHLETALAGFPKSADIHVRIGKILEEKNKHEQALEHYKKAIELDPANGTALSKVGIATIEEGNSKEAYDLLYKARHYEPDNPDTLRALGSVMTEMGNNREAVEILEQTLLFDQKNPETHWYLAKAYENLRNSAKAAEHYELARKYGRRAPEVKELIGFDLARSLMKSGNYEDAEKEYKKAIRKTGDAGRGYYELGQLHLDLGREDQAIKSYVKAYENDRQYGQGIMDAAEIYMDREEYDKAEELYKMLNRDKTFKEDAKYAREELEERRKLDERLKLEQKLNESWTTDGEVEATYFNLLDQNSKNEVALEGLWNFYEERGYFKDALKYFRKYNRLRPVSDYEKESIENELKDKFKRDNYLIFGYASEQNYSKAKPSDSDLKNLADYGENDRVREEALNVLVWRKTRKDERGFSTEGKHLLERLLDFYEERGNLKGARKCVTALKRYDWWSDYEASEKRRELTENFKFK
jgi:tetratricopeptide (TPR) repeat protein